MQKDVVDVVVVVLGGVETACPKELVNPVGDAILSTCVARP